MVESTMPTVIPLRLLALERRDRADFLLLAMPNADLRDACRKLGLTFPGYRLERMDPGPMADALADCYEESEEDAAAIDRIVDECCPLPPEIPEEFVPDSRIAARMVELLSRLAPALRSTRSPRSCGGCSHIRSRACARPPPWRFATTSNGSTPRPRPNARARTGRRPRRRPRSPEARRTRKP
jgi:hypothetical protein